MEENGLKMASGKGFEVIRVETYVGNCVGNRVGSEGLVPSLSSHTTVRAVRHTAVRKDKDLE